MKTDAIHRMWCMANDGVQDFRGQGVLGEAHMELNSIENHACHDPQTLVTEFHRKMGLPVASEPTVGAPRQRELRFRLMLEEVFEWGKAAGVRVRLRGATTIIKGVGELQIDATHEPDLVQMTHELADVQYVVSGTAAELGLPVREALPLIHEANMRKEPVLDSGGKVRKPEGWVPADVSGLLKK